MELANHPIFLYISWLERAPSLPPPLLAWSSARPSSQTLLSLLDHLRLSPGLFCFPTIASTIHETIPLPHHLQALGQELRPRFVYPRPSTDPTSSMSSRTLRHYSPTLLVLRAIRQPQASKYSLPSHQASGDSLTCDQAMGQPQALSKAGAIRFPPTARG